MNFPVGKVLERNVKVKEISEKKILELGKEKFSGYIVSTINTKHGMEEGVILFSNGAVVASVYEDLADKSRNFLAEKALDYSLNSLNSETGIFDLVELSRQQIDLVLAFNSQIKLAKEVSATSAAKKLGQKLPTDSERETEESKFNVFKRFGLSSLGK